MIRIDFCFFLHKRHESQALIFRDKLNVRKLLWLTQFMRIGSTDEYANWMAEEQAIGLRYFGVVGARVYRQPPKRIAIRRIEESSEEMEQHRIGGGLRHAPVGFPCCVSLAFGCVAFW